MAVPDATPVSAEDLAAAMRVINAARATPSGSAMAHNTGHQMHQQPQMQQQFFPEEPASEPGFAMSPAQSALMALAAGPSGDLGGALHAGFPVSWFRPRALLGSQWYELAVAWSFVFDAW